MARLVPKVGKYYKHPLSCYAYLVTNVSEYHYEFTYVFSGDIDDRHTYTFKLEEFSEIELTELEQALL